MTKEQTFLIARGVPGSGKSTWAEQWVQEDPLNRIRVNRDDLRKHLIQAEPDKWQSNDGWYVLKDGMLDRDFEAKVTNLEHNLIHRALKSGKSVVSDNTNLVPKAAATWVNIANQHKVPVQVKEFPISKEEAIRRDAGRERTVGPQVIEAMFNRLGPNGEFHHIDGTFAVQKYRRPEKRGQHAVGFDLDGTLCDVRSIRHFVQKDEKGRRNFDMFHRSSLFCPPNEEVVQILKDAQAAGYAILITTARGADYREVSQRWLQEHGITFDNYYCRKKGDSRPDYVVKDEMYHEISRDYDLVHQVDDNPQAVQSFEKNGVLVTKVAFGDDAPATGVIKVNNIFKTGGCLRCGKPLSKGQTIGPRCAKKA